MRLGSGFSREEWGGRAVLGKATLRWRPACGGSDPARPDAKEEGTDFGWVLSQRRLAVGGKDSDVSGQGALGSKVALMAAGGRRVARQVARTTTRAALHFRPSPG